jgi:hypothetical protein
MFPGMPLLSFGSTQALRRSPMCLPTTTTSSSIHSRTCVKPRFVFARIRPLHVRSLFVLGPTRPHRSPLFDCRSAVATAPVGPKVLYVQFSDEAGASVCRHLHQVRFIDQVLNVSRSVFPFVLSSLILYPSPRPVIKRPPLRPRVYPQEIAIRIKAITYARTLRAGASYVLCSQY